MDTSPPSSSAGRSTTLERLRAYLQLPQETTAGFPGWASAWWEQHAVGSLAERQVQAVKRRRCHRQLQRRRPLDVDADYQSGLTAHLSVGRDPSDVWRPYTAQEHLMQLHASFPGPGRVSLSGNAMQGSADDGTAGIGLAACAPLDTQGRATLHASAAAYSDELPILELEMDDRQYLLLPKRHIFHTHRLQYTPTDGECAASSSTALHFCGDALELAATFATDLRDATVAFDIDFDAGFGCGGGASTAEEVFGGSIRSGGGRRRSGLLLRRAKAGLVQQVANGISQLNLEGEQQLNESGMLLGAAWQSEEGSLRSGTWHCELRCPTLQSENSLTVRVTGGPKSGTTPSLRCEFAPLSDGTAGLSYRGTYSKESGPEVGVAWAPWSGTEDDFVESGQPWALLSTKFLGSTGPRAQFDVLIPH